MMVRFSIALCLIALSALTSAVPRSVESSVLAAAPLPSQGPRPLRPRVGLAALGFRLITNATIDAPSQDLSTLDSTRFDLHPRRKYIVIVRADAALDSIQLLYDLDPKGALGNSQSNPWRFGPIKRFRPPDSTSYNIDWPDVDREGGEAVGMYTVQFAQPFTSVNMELWESRRIQPPGGWR